jgi:dienelactone hydrolase
MARLGELMGDAAATRRLGRAGLDILLDRPEVDRSRVAAIGYCFGGTVALELARDGADLKAVVGFHAGLGTAAPAAPGAVTSAVLVCCGADDPVATDEHRAGFEREMRDAQVADWRMEVYGGVGHSFTNPRVDGLGMPGFAFDAAANRRSWRSMLDLFEETLAPFD